MSLRFLSSLLFSARAGVSPLSLPDRGSVSLRGSPYTAAECGCRQAVLQNKLAGKRSPASDFSWPDRPNVASGVRQDAVRPRRRLLLSRLPWRRAPQMSHGSAAFFGRWAELFDWPPMQTEERTKTGSSDEAVRQVVRQVTTDKNQK